MKYHPGKRLLFLGVVNALILLHILAYYVFDRTEIGCVDFFGLATFLGKGEITAGTIFLGLLILGTLILGRMFCGWGCHFALFQDLLTRTLDRFGISPPFRRSRLEYVVPPLLLFVTLLYPIIAWWQSEGIPGGVSMNVGYPEVWHLLPGLKGVLLILVVDVVALTLLFGSRAFCRYVCPYGLFLKVFHVLSPTRVVKTDTCEDCSACAGACPTGVPIKHEVERYGVIHDLNCMNCGDCVAACPSGALSLRPTRRAYTRLWERIATKPSQPRWAELLLLSSAVLGLFLFRGREFGDFLAVGIGLTAGGAAIAAVRPAPFVRVWRSRGISRKTVQVVCGLLAIYLGLGLASQAHALYTLRLADRALEEGEHAQVWQHYSRGMRAHAVFRPFAFYLDDFADRARARTGDLVAEGDRLMQEQSWTQAEWIYRTIILLDERRLAAHGNLGMTFLKQGHFWEASRCYLTVLDHDPNDLVALYHLAVVRIQLDQHEDAVSLVRRMLDIDTVGNAYELIRRNPLFGLLERVPEYRRTMAAYSMTRSGPLNPERGVQ